MTSLYEADFAGWIGQQVRAIRKVAQSGTNLPIDFENVAEELARWGAAKSER